jgi:hypothetical protein
MKRIPPQRPNSDEGLRQFAEGERHRIARDFGSYSPAIPIALAVSVLIVVAATIRLLFLG